MSVKYFCDKCKGEINPADDAVSHQIVREWGPVTVKVLVAVNGTWNGGNVCRDCVVETVVNGTNH